MLSLVHEFAGHEKAIFAIGHGIQVLIAAGLTKGRNVTCHAHVRVEVERSGGNLRQQAGGPRRPDGHRADLEIAPGVLPRGLRLPRRGARCAEFAKLVAAK